MIRVNTPDGGVAEFPDETPLDVIKGALRKKFAPQQTAAPGKGDRERSWGETGMDVAKSAGTGLAEGAVGLLTMPQDIGTWLGQKATGAVDSLLGVSPEQTQATRAAVAQNRMPLQAPTSNEVLGAVESVTGPMYQPQTTAGQYGKTIASFVPAAASGPGGLLRKGAMAVVPGTASEAAGQATEGTAAEPYARFGGALLGGLAASARSGSALKEMRTKAPTMEQVAADTTAAYKAIDDARIVFDPNSYKSTAMKIQSDLRKHGLMPEQGGPDASLLNLVMARAKSGKLNGWTEVDSIRQRAGDVAFGGKATEQEAARAKIIRSHLDDLVNSGKVVSLKGVERDQVRPMVEKARELARRQILARDIAKMEDKSQWYVSGDESGLRNQFASYGKKKGQKLTDEEKAAFDKVLRRENINGVVTNLGGKLAPLILGGAAFPAGGLLGSMAVGGLHLGARALAKAQTLKAVKNAKKTVLAGREAQKTAAEAAKVLRGQAAIQALLASERGREEAFPLPSYAPLLGR